VDVNNARTLNRRGFLFLTADPGVELPRHDLVVWGEGMRDGGTELLRRAHGAGMTVEVAGATAQGVVDRQRAVTAPWLALDLPASSTTPPVATLAAKQVRFTRMEEGDRYDFEYEWKPRAKDVQLPDELAVDVIGARDIRVTAFQTSGNAGSFSINTTKATEPARYDIVMRGRVKMDGQEVDIYARPLALVVTERSDNVQVSTAR
jgi:hypothetical protein